MYYAWEKHGILPSVSYQMTRGEMLVLLAFYEIEQENKRRR